MSFEPQSIFLSSSYATGFLALSTLLLGACIFLGVALWRRRPVYDEDLERRKRDAEASAKEIISRARDEQIRIIQEAERKAVDLLHKVEFTNAVASDVSRELGVVLKEFLAGESGRLSQAAEEFLRVYRSIGENSEKVYTQTLDSAASIMTENARETMLKFEQSLKQELARYETATNDRIKEWQAEARSEIEQYKERTFTRIDDAIYQIILFVSKRVLGRSLDMRDHQELVIRSLDEAKKAGLFLP